MDKGKCHASKRKLRWRWQDLWNNSWDYKSWFRM